VSGARFARGGATTCASTSACFQRSAPSTTHEPAPDRERHRAQREPDVLGRRLVAFDDLQATGAALGLGPRAQAGAPLADPTGDRRRG